MNTKVGVLVELDDHKIKPANLGVVTLARSNRPSDLYAIAVNADKKDLSEKLSRYGVEKIIHLSIPEETVGNPDVMARAVIDAVNHYGITTLFGLSTSKGKDILPRIAALMDSPLVMDCVAVDLEKSTARTSQYSGKTMATLKISGGVPVFGVRPNVIEPEEWPVKTQYLDHDDCRLAEKGMKVLKIGKTSDRSGISLMEANVIVSGGRGMKNGENFELLARCAGLMNGAVGSSRVAVDSGWVPYALQVGQTGEKVSPKVYIACGISGSIQHFAGMKTADLIIAINTDDKAPIIANCDYYAKADALNVIEKISQILEND